MPISAHYPLLLSKAMERVEKDYLRKKLLGKNKEIYI